MAERIGHWLAGVGMQVMAWFDAQPGGVQFLLVVVIALLMVGAAHLDELKRAREWREFRLWRESQRRPLRGMKR